MLIFLKQFTIFKPFDRIGKGFTERPGMVTQLSLGFGVADM